ncbi:MAG: hypothetical protein Q7O66_08100 [Dehalococcoidia bacterium]|nr:hypothetical protein [Dehalococcoidia bacterium]
MTAKSAFSLVWGRSDRSSAVQRHASAKTSGWEVGKGGREKKMESTRRFQRRMAGFGLVLALIGLAMMVNPFVPGLNLAELGFMLAFFGWGILRPGQPSL